MDRRNFILWAATGFLGLGCNARGERVADLEDWLLEEVGGSLGPRNPEQVGPLTERELRSLLGLFRFIGKRWELFDSDAVAEGQLASLIQPKCELRPSYRTEYREAVAVLSRLHQSTGLLDGAYRRLLAGSGSAEFPRTRLGRAQHFVGRELIAWSVSQGGFRRFGYTNYRGFPGGLLAASPPPYRTA